MTEDQIVEAMARAMCQLKCSRHESPDDDAMIPDPNNLRGFRRGKAWELFKEAAEMQYRAWLAMQSVILGEAPQKPQEHEKAPKGL